MEKQSHRGRNSFFAAALSIAALSGCSIDSYLTNPSDVQCNGQQTEVDLTGNGMVTFIVHGKHNADVATVQVRRSGEDASVRVTGDVTGLWGPSVTGKVETGETFYQAAVREAHILGTSFYH